METRDPLMNVCHLEGSEPTLYLEPLGATRIVVQQHIPLFQRFQYCLNRVKETNFEEYYGFNSQKKENFDTPWIYRCTSRSHLLLKLLLAEKEHIFNKLLRTYPITTSQIAFGPNRLRIQRGHFFNDFMVWRTVFCTYPQSFRCILQKTRGEMSMKCCWISLTGLSLYMKLFYYDCD